MQLIQVSPLGFSWQFSSTSALTRFGRWLAEADVGGVGRHQDVERRAALERGDAADLPAAEHAAQQEVVGVAEERHVPQVADDQPVRHVPVGRAVVAPDVEVVHRLAAAVGVRGHVARLRPRVVRVEHEAVGHAPARGERDRVVVGDEVVLDRADLAEQLIRTTRIEGAGPRLRLVVVEAAIEVLGVRRQVPEFDDRVPEDLVLQVQRSTGSSSRWACAGSA